MPIVQIFRKDRKFWTQVDIEEVELFFMLNPFFSKFYEHEDFDKIVNFTFYSKLQQGQQMLLELNKKSQIVILLSGQINIYRKLLERQNKKKPKRKEDNILHQNYILQSSWRNPYELIQIRNDVLLQSKSQFSQFLFVPIMLYETHNYIVNNRRLDRIITALQIIFRDVSKRDLKNLAETGCSFKEFKMNSHIYRAGTVPQYCYILITGTVKLQSSGFSAKNLMEMSIVSQKSLFGHKDLNQQYRIFNSLCCSSHCRVLQIKKEPFNKFMMKNQNINPAYVQKLKRIQSQKSGEQKFNTILTNYQQKHLFPRIIRYHSNVKPQQEEKIEELLVRNCHMLINLNEKPRVKSSFRLPRKIDRDYSISEFDNKIGIYKRLKGKSQPISHSNPLF